MRTIILPLANVSYVYENKQDNSTCHYNYGVGDKTSFGDEIIRITTALPLEALGKWIADGWGKLDQEQAYTMLEDRTDEDTDPWDFVNVVLAIADLGHEGDHVEINIEDSTIPEADYKNRTYDEDVAINGTVRLNIEAEATDENWEFIEHYAKARIMDFYSEQVKRYPELTVILGDSFFKQDKGSIGTNRWVSYADYTLEHPKDDEYSWMSAKEWYENTHYTKYRCPDCGWETIEPEGRPLVKGRDYCYRCRNCGSLNTERRLTNGMWWKADMMYPQPKKGGTIPL